MWRPSFILVVALALASDALGECFMCFNLFYRIWRLAQERSSTPI